MPDTGKLEFLGIPDSNEHIRVETGVRQGDNITVYYDPMIAKVIAKGQDRVEALRRLDQALQEFHVVGVRTNIPLIRKILAQEAFRHGSVDTGFIKSHHEILFEKSKPKAEHVALAAVIQILVAQSTRSFSLITNQVKILSISVHGLKVIYFLPLSHGHSRSSYVLMMKIWNVLLQN